MAATTPSPAPGPGVDAKGNPVVDPTQNVLDLVRAAIERQDDLREMEARHIRELMNMRERYQGELRTAETARIDAIRAVDVGAVTRAAEVASAAATALQAQVQAAAEAMRTSLAGTAQANADALVAAIRPLADAVAAVQQQQYMQAGGKAQVVESRDVRGESRLNLGAVLGGVSVLLVLVFGIVGLVIAQ